MTTRAIERAGSLRLIAFCLAATACHSPAPPEYPGARALFDRGEYDAAGRAAEDGLRRAPDDAMLRRLAMTAAARTGESRRAVDLYEQWHRERRHYDPVAMRAVALGTVWLGTMDRSTTVRVRAVEIIGELESLGGRNADDDPLDQAGDLERRLVALLDDPSHEVAAAAGAALLGRDAGHARAAARLAELLASAEPSARARAWRVLVKVRPEEARAYVEKALRDTEPHVRRVALMGLADATRLAEIARTDSDGSVRAAALGGLARAGRDIALPAARAALTDSYLGARLAAIELLARWPDATRGDLVTLASSLASHDDLYVALRAAVALRKTGGEPPFQPVELALGSRAWNVRVAALNALTGIAPWPTALALARGALRDGRVEVRLASARILARAPAGPETRGAREQAADVFADALVDASADIAVNAAIDLLRLHDDRGHEAIVALARNPSAVTRRAAVAAHRYTSGATLPLVSALADSSADVRLEAAHTLLVLLAR